MISVLFQVVVVVMSGGGAWAPFFIIQAEVVEPLSIENSDRSP